MNKFRTAIFGVAMMGVGAVGASLLNDHQAPLSLLSLDAPVSFMQREGDQISITRGYLHPTQGQVSIRLETDSFHDTLTRRDMKGLQVVDIAMGRYGWTPDPIGPGVYEKPVMLETRHATRRGQHSNLVEIGASGSVTIDKDTNFHRNAIVSAVLKDSTRLN